MSVLKSSTVCNLLFSAISLLPEKMTLKLSTSKEYIAQNFNRHECFWFYLIFFGFTYSVSQNAVLTVHYGVEEIKRQKNVKKILLDLFADLAIFESGTHQVNYFEIFICMKLS
jgi:hypothetical protein